MKTPRVTRRLIGVGVGPGDPELVTLKAARVLGEADAILVPATEASAESPDGAGRAERLVLAACPDVAPAIRRVPFRMADRRGVTDARREAWEASAAAALAAYDDGARTVAFATVGDPSVYSTFSYLAAHVLAARPDVAVEVVPGITAMQALAAAERTPLVEGGEILALVPMTAGTSRYAEALRVADTVVAYKAGRSLPQVRAVLREAGREGDTVLGENVGLADERRVRVADLPDVAAPYFATLLTTPRRDTIGGAL